MFALRSLALTGILFASTAALPAHAAGPFDGTYAGTNTNTASGGAGCAEGGPAARVVTDSSFVLKWAGRDARFEVGADGTINSSANVGIALLNAKGKIAGGVMTYDVTSQRCSFHFEGRKR